MWNNKRVSLIFPTYNEKDSIREAIIDFEKGGYIDEIIVVNNNAAKGTSEEVAKANSKITREVFESKQGYGFAIRRGFKEATGDLLIVSEPDATFFGNDVIKLLSYSDDFDAVYGSRTSRQLIWKGANMGLFLRWGNLFVAKLMEILFNTTNLTDVGCTMRLVKREVINKIDSEFTVGKEHFGPEMMILTFLHGFSVIQIPVNYYERIGASSVTGSHWKAFKLGIIMFLLILKYRLSYFGRFHIPAIKNLFTELHEKVSNFLEINIKLKIPLIYFISFGYFVFFFWLTYIRWKAHAPTMDYHAYIQMLWNTAQGKLLFFNQNRGEQISFFRLHFAPFLILIAGVYKLFPHPLTLYFVFNVFIAASIVPIYLIAKDVLKSKLSGYLVSAIYGLYHPFVWSHRQGFCEEAFATPLLAFAFYFLYAKRKKLFVLFSLLTLGLRINMTMPVLMLGIYAFFSKKARLQGIFLSIISVFWIYYVIKYITPVYSAPNTEPYILAFFKEYGETYSEIFRTLVFNPKLVFDTVFVPNKLIYLRNLFEPLFLVPLLAPTTLLIGSPTVIIALLASSPRLSSTRAYYHSSVTPFLFYALIFSLNKIKTKTKPWIATLVLLIMLGYAFINNWLTSNGTNWPFSRYFNHKYYETNERDKQTDIILSSLPVTNSAGIQEFFVEHVAERKWYYGANSYQGYLPDLIFVDPWQGAVGNNLASGKDWINIASDSYLVLYARKDLVNEFDISEDTFDLSLFPKNKEYLAVFNSNTNTSKTSTGIGRDQAVDITGDVIFAQELELKSSEPSLIEVPVERLPFVYLDFSDRLTYYIRPPRGALKVQIITKDESAPFGKTVFEKTYEYGDLTYKIGILYLDVSDVDFDLDKSYWLKFSLDTNDGKNYGKFNSFRIYTAEDTKEKATENRISSDEGKHWKNTYGSKDLLYTIYYELGEDVRMYSKNRLKNGTYVFKQTPDVIEERITKIYEENNNYNNLVLVGIPRSTE